MQKFKLKNVDSYNVINLRIMLESFIADNAINGLLLERAVLSEMYTRLLNKLCIVQPKTNLTLKYSEAIALNRVMLNYPFSTSHSETKQNIIWELDKKILDI